MKTQISRNSFLVNSRYYAGTRRYYTGVYQQQGRMLTDADWNEQVSIGRAILDDVLWAIFRDEGVLQSGHSIDADGKKFFSWYVYAKGLCSWLDVPFAEGQEVPDYGNQMDFPEAPGRLSEGDRLYADVWERSVLSLEDPGLKDPGLHGADTCTRTQMVLQLKRAPAGIESEVGAPSYLDRRVNPRQGNALLTVSRRAALSGNHLFRVEVHDVQGKIPTAPTRLTLKWSSENGAEAYASRDVPMDFERSDWAFEFYNDTTEKHLGTHLVVDESKGTPARGKLFKGPPSATTRPDAGVYPYVRRWDGFCTLSRSSSDDAWTLEDGWDRGDSLLERERAGVHGHARIQDNVLFVNLQSLDLELELTYRKTPSDNPSSRSFVTGDYWLVPVREQNALGGTLLDKGTPIGSHSYVHLGVIKDGKFVEEAKGIPSLADLTRTYGSDLIGSRKISSPDPDGPFLAQGTVYQQLTQLLEMLGKHLAPSSSDHDSRYALKNHRHSEQQLIWKATRRVRLPARAEMSAYHPGFWKGPGDESLSKVRVVVQLQGRDASSSGTFLGESLSKVRLFSTLADRQADEAPGVRHTLRFVLINHNDFEVDVLYDVYYAEGYAVVDEPK
jgi:hypothetical protein